MTWPTEQVREAVVKALSAHWRDMHTNEALGRQRMLARHTLEAIAPHVAALVRAERAAALREAADERAARLAAVEALAEGPTGDGYQPYAVTIDGEVHLAVLLDDLRAALATSALEADQ